MKKAFALLTIVFILNACSAAPVASPVIKPLQDITFSHYFTEPLNGGINEMVSVFNAEQTLYRLKTIPIDHEAYKISMSDDIQRANPAEVYSYWAGARVADVVDNLQPIDVLWDDEGLDNVFDLAIIASACTYEGKKYLLPITQHPVILLYNKKVFESLKLSPPKNWNAFLSVIKTVQQSGRTPIALGTKNKWPAQFWFDYVLLRTAGTEYRNQLMQGDARYTDPEVRKVFSILASLIDTGAFTANAEKNDWYEAPLEAFAKGDAAMTLMGTWAIGVLSAEPFYLTAGKDYDYFMFPEITEGVPQEALGTVDGLVVPKKTMSIDGSDAVLAFMAKNAAQEAMSTGSGALSPSILVPDGFYTDLQRRLKADLLGSSGWSFNYDLSTPPKIADVGLNLFQEFWILPESYPYLLNEADLKIHSLWLEREKP